MVTRWDPFMPMVSLQEAMNRLLDDSFVRSSPFWTAGGASTVPFDLYETGDDVIVRAAIPGADPSSIEISLEHGVLTFKAYRSFYTGEEEREYRWHLRGLSEGEFQFSVTLPAPVVADKADARCENGVATIRLPKAEDAKPKRISIQTGAKAEELPAGSR